jgi:hypothetical protein
MKMFEYYKMRYDKIQETIEKAKAKDAGKQRESSKEGNKKKWF